MVVVKNSQSGFSLVEMLVAVLILAVGLLGMAQLQVTAIKANSQSATSTAATALAQKVIEEIAAMPGSDVMFDAPGTGTWLFKDGSTQINVAGGGTYQITWVVEEVIPPTSATAITNLYKVTVAVTSTTELMHVLSHRVRLAEASTLKRAI